MALNFETTVAIIVAVLASGGLWNMILYKIQRKDNSKDNLTQLMLGLSYKQIIDLCMKYITRGFITKDEYEDLVQYLYKPYKALGGNGTAEKLVDEVKKLPVRQRDTL